MKVLSLFSGVGGFDMGLEAAGMTTVGLCEIDANCRKVLRRHWPTVPIYEDVSTVTATQLLADGVVPDVVAFGSPCQDLSVAGKRAGLAGSRSGLFGEAMRIIRELRKETNGTSPTWAIWENVPGAFNSTSGRDFAAVLDAMADAGAMVIEWACLDAQNYGVPQRRRRIFLVACFDPATSARCPDPLLPVGEGSPRDIEASRKARKGVAAQIAGGVGSGSEYTMMRQREGKPGGGKGPLLSEDSSLSLKASNDQTVFQPLFSFDTQFGANANVFENQSPTLKASQQPPSITEPMLVDGRRVDDVRVYEPPVQTLQERMGTGGNNVPMVAQPVVMFDGYNQKAWDDVHPPLRTAGDAGDHVQQPIPIQDGQDMDKRQNGLGVGMEGNPSYTIDQTGGQSVAQPVVVFEPMSMGDENWTSREVKNSLRAGESKSAYAVVQTLAVRRLTPLECERLMGWPDDHTRWADDGTEIKDTNRYKMCGNGIASPVAAWVGKHIMSTREQ